jgi:hypothetical protein
MSGGDWFSVLSVSCVPRTAFPVWIDVTIVVTTSVYIYFFCCCATVFQTMQKLVGVLIRRCHCGGLTDECGPRDDQSQEIYKALRCVHRASWYCGAHSTALKKVNVNFLAFDWHGKYVMRKSLVC